MVDTDAQRAVPLMVRGVPPVHTVLPTMVVPSPPYIYTTLPSRVHHTGLSSTTATCRPVYLRRGYRGRA